MVKRSHQFHLIVLCLLLPTHASLLLSQSRPDPCRAAPPRDGTRDPCVSILYSHVREIEDSIPELDRKVKDARQVIDQRTSALNQQISTQEIETQDRVKGVNFNADRFWVLLAAVLVFFMQAGFKCLEVGMVRNKFDALQAIQKMFAWIMTFVGYFPVGFSIMFGITTRGFFGPFMQNPQNLILAANALIADYATVMNGTPGPVVRGLEFFLFQAAFAATAVTIPAGATAERMSLKTYIWSALFISAIVYPVFGHWAWGGNTYAISQPDQDSQSQRGPVSDPPPSIQDCVTANTSCGRQLTDILSDNSSKTYSESMRKSAGSLQKTVESNAPLQGWLQGLGFHDFAGSTVVHSVGGWFALVATLFLGARKGRFGDDGAINTADFPSRSRGYAVLGVFMLWFGWWGFNGGSLLSFHDKVAEIILNTNLAGAGAGLSAYLFAYIQEYLPVGWSYKGFVVEKTIGGALGGLVAITACCDLVSQWQAFFVVGLLAGFVHNLVFDLLLRCKVDDPVGAFPVHTGCGILGTLLVSIAYHPADPRVGHVQQFFIQLRGVTMACFWTVGTAALFFASLKMLARLPVVGTIFQLTPPENEWLSMEATDVIV